ncbi:MAG TPA: hypothetical protein V6D26_19150, partial [Stenomitos sp.]
MIAKSARYALGFFGLAGSLAFIAAAPAHAQQQPPSSGQDIVNITGGQASFIDGTVFVPGSGTSGSSSLVYGSSVKDGTLRIQTNRGDIPTPILFKEGTVPTLNITAGGTPAVGNTGSVDGNVSFRAFTSDGQPALFIGLPATLEFTLTSVDSTGSNFDSTKYSTPPDYTLITSGGVATSGSSTSTGSAIANVLVFQVQPKGSDPTDQTILGTTIPAADFTDEVNGKSYPTDFDVDLTGGFLTIPTPPGFSATGSSSSNGNSNSNSNSSSNSDTDFASSDTTFIPEFSGSNDESIQNVFSTEYQPSSGEPIAEGSDDTGSGRVYRIGENYYVTVGLSSRVFPGLIGV